MYGQVSSLHHSTHEGFSCYTGLDGDAGTEDAGIDGDDIPICGTCTGEGGIHAAIVVTDLGGIAVAKMQVDKMELTWNGKHN